MSQGWLNTNVVVWMSGLSLSLTVSISCSVEGQRLNGQGVSVRSVSACRPLARIA